MSFLCRRAHRHTCSRIPTPSMPGRFAARSCPLRRMVSIRKFLRAAGSGILKVEEQSAGRPMTGTRTSVAWARRSQAPVVSARSLVQEPSPSGSIKCEGFPAKAIRPEPADRSTRNSVLGLGTGFVACSKTQRNPRRSTLMPAIKPLPRLDAQAAAQRVALPLTTPSGQTLLTEPKPMDTLEMLKACQTISGHVNITFRERIVTTGLLRSVAHFLKCVS